MAIDEKVAEAVRGALADAPGVREVKMFGGLGFMLGGNLLACTSGRGLLVRVGEAGKADAVERGATPMVMNGREMKGFVWVKGSLDARGVRRWVREAQTFVETLPAKTARPKPARTTARPKPAGTAKITARAATKPAAKAKPRRASSGSRA